METLSPTYLWLIAGVILALAEMHFAGIGLFFAGLGAISAGSAIYLGWVGEQDTLRQFIVFFASTGLLALLLWKPLQRFRRLAPGYSNIVGETAYVGSQGISKTRGGEVTWSGTVMKAQLAKQSTLESLEAGTPVTIVEVKGATLIVKPKQ